MTNLGLTLNEAKTPTEASTESFAFLGYSFGPHYPYKAGTRRQYVRHRFDEQGWETG